MRTILIIIMFLAASFLSLSAQSDFISRDKNSYDYFMKGDYKNLRMTADSMLANGMDYYYLRMRLGILAFNNKMYSSALINFKKALEFSSIDTVSREYIYYSYLFSGRNADANLYLESLPDKYKNGNLKSLSTSGSTDIYAGSSISGYDEILYKTNNLNYEAIKNCVALNAVVESFLSPGFKGMFSYMNFRKTGTEYSSSSPYGMDLNFVQNQVYTRLTFHSFPGWEFSAFGHVAFYSETFSTGLPATGNSGIIQMKEYLGGAGISKNSWKIRAGANISFSNFGKSNQVRGEGYLTYLPFSNLNLYFTSGGMYQTDTNWGGTYQINEEIGLKIMKSLWIETGIVTGNSFLYSRNQGFFINNSFLIPATTVFSNIIILPWKHFNFTLTPFYSKNQIYSWDLNAHYRTNKLYVNSFGVSIKLSYKN
jgi:hypothetical protein